MTKRNAYGTLIVIACLWGSTFLMIQDSLQFIGPFGFNALRFAIGSLALLLTIRREVFKLSAKYFRLAIFSGICLGAGYFFQTIGLRFTTTSKAAFITGSTVMLVPLIELIFFRRRLGKTQSAAVLIAFVGLLLLTWKPGLTFATGDLLVLASAALFAVQLICVSASGSAEPLRFTLVQLIVVAALSLAGALICETTHFPLPMSVWATLAYTGIITTALTFLLQTKAQKVVPASWTALLLALEPVAASLLGWAVAGERMNNGEVFGCGLMLAATTFPIWKKT